MSVRESWVYILTNTANGKKYVGSSRHPSVRYNNHMGNLRSNRHICQEMQDDYNRFGEVFTYEVVGKNEGEGVDSAEYTVMRALKTFDERFGYNTHDSAMKTVKKDSNYLAARAFEEDKPSNMPIDEREELENLASTLASLDEQSLVLIRNGITILADRQKMAQVESWKESK